MRHAASHPDMYRASRFLAWNQIQHILYFRPFRIACKSDEEIRIASRTTNRHGILLEYLFPFSSSFLPCCSDNI
uniref:Uncharacterized protein n=1 Tax=Triticum urartu TaxID=4572 RepID=A0A8R7JXN1_TRIUA